MVFGGVDERGAELTFFVDILLAEPVLVYCRVGNGGMEETPLLDSFIW